MRKLISLLAMTATVALAGCMDLDVKLPRKINIGGGNGGRDKPAPRQKKEEFQGWHLTVWVDGDKTKATGRKMDGQLVWKADDIEPNPIIKFTFDEAHLGRFRQLQVTINPTKADGSRDYGRMYKPRGVQIPVGKDIRLASFEFFDGRRLSHVSGLPTGRYILSVRVTGERSWDRQCIPIKVE